ncbi:DUF4365 domain-containing protein [Spirosoma sp.]|uniref:DUF4365 domain-containing protein n=1 Tax=Spirosoma sp. TaxID=1899569 RepID=UPI002633AC28|nr:DUF4365 domain-containing protein [Spirosoma sp.]MCX6214565.1 DUF4365 domain-containing protein [Spirosoma sp.]
MADRKRRTREHIIADLSVNNFERIALLTGYSVERTVHDYGYDVLLYTYNNIGEIENGYVSVQLKASDSLSFIDSGTAISFPVSKKDLNLWLAEYNPVILVIYDSIGDVGYWLYIQKYLEDIKGFSLSNVKKWLNVRIPIKQKIEENNMRTFAKYKANLYSQIHVKHSI